MRTYIGDQEFVNAFEFQELAYGFADPTAEDFRELFVGRPDESPEQRAVRREVAREVLAELLEESEGSEVALLNAIYAAQLVSVVPLVRHRSGELVRARMRKAA